MPLQPMAVSWRPERTAIAYLWGWAKQLADDVWFVKPVSANRELREIAVTPPAAP